MKTIDDAMWVIVPREPTDAMAAAANSAPIPAVLLDSISGMNRLVFAARWRAAISAAPPCPTGDEHAAGRDVDGERWRYIRRKFAIVNGEFVALNLPRPTYIAPDPVAELEAAIDTAMQAQEKGNGA